jgi:hypothetical protein
VTSEKSILNDELVDLSAMPETFVWRHNSGAAWQGQQATVQIGRPLYPEPGMVVLRNARQVKFGLLGSSDIIGATRGRPLAVETKTAGGSLDRQQILFGQAWERAGGLWVVSRGRGQAREMIDKALSA